MIPEDISDFTLEQYLLGELPNHEQNRIERLVTTDPDLQARIGRMDHDSGRFLREHPAAAVLNKAEFQTAPSPGTRVGRRFSFTGLALAGLGAAATVLILPLVLQGNPGPDSRIKGGAGAPRGQAQTLDRLSDGISVFLLRGEGSVPLSPGAFAHEGDRIQVALRTEKDQYALLLSIDGTGRLTLHAPDSLKSPLKVSGSSPLLLPFAYQLDNAPDFERFVLVTATGTFDPQKVWAEVQAQTSTWRGAHPGEPPVLRLDQGLHIGVFDILKPGKGNS